jgi:hypothetical protein
MDKKIESFIPELNKILGKGYDIHISTFGHVLVRKDDKLLFKVCELLMEDGFSLRLEDRSSIDLAKKVAKKLKIKFVE